VEVSGSLVAFAASVEFAGLVVFTPSSGVTSSFFSFFTPSSGVTPSSGLAPSALFS
jgi:hypothetical protein